MASQKDDMDIEMTIDSSAEPAACSGMQLPDRDSAPTAQKSDEGLHSKLDETIVTEEVSQNATSLTPSDTVLPNSSHSSEQYAGKNNRPAGEVDTDDVHDATVGPDMDDDASEDDGIGNGVGTANTVTDPADVEEDDLTIGIEGNVRDDITVMGDLTAADEGVSADAGPPVDDDDDDDQTVFTEIDETNAGQTNVGQSDIGQTRVTTTRFGKSHSDKTSSDGTKSGKTQFGKTRFRQARTRGNDGNSRSGRSNAEKGGKQKLSEGPRYDMIDNFARGGIGKIWLAKDGMLQREVAYKELLPRAMRRASVVERFVQEGQVTGQLEHPGIVPIYDLGYQENGTPFYTMKLVRGTEMKDQIEALHEIPQNTSERHRAFVKLLGQFVDVCNALAFAHQRGVLHRDLKPQNVMIGGFGETLVLDWGLAKVLGRSEPGASSPGVAVTGTYDDEFSPELDEDQSDPGSPTVHTDDSSGRDPAKNSGNSGTDATNIIDDSNAGETRISGSGKGSTSKTTGPAEKPVGQSVAPEPGKTQGLHGESKTVKTNARSEGMTTRYGSVMGTLAYMPPEQAEGKFDEMDARTDIYSLGAILYEILVNDAPIPRGKMEAMLDHVIRKPIISPREVDPTVPKPLNAIAMKALNKKMSDRYRSALDLARDVEDYLADEPISVYEEPWVDRLRRWARTRRSLVTGVLTAAGVLVAGSVAWVQLEAYGVARIEMDARNATNRARTAVEEGRLAQAIDLLGDAETMVRATPQLVDLAESISGQQRYVKQLMVSAETQRLEQQRQLAEADLVSARSLITSGDLAEARDILTRVETQLQNEPKLKSVADVAAELSRQVVSTLASQQQQTEALQNLARFHQQADLARQYASFFSGERIAGDIQKARQHATEAVALYSLEEPWETSPEWLTREQIQHVRTTGFELLLLLAEIELADAALTNQTGAVRQPDDHNDSHLEASLKLIEAADALGFQTRTLELRRAECFDQLGRSNARDVALAKAEQLQPSTRLDYFLQGEYERKAGRLDNAIAAYRHALREAADDFWSTHFLGLCLYQQGEVVGAVSQLTACVAFRPEFVWTYLARAVAFAEMNDFDAAYADLAMAEQLEPTLFAIGVNRGGLLLRQGRLQEAIEQFERSAELDNLRAEPWMNLGEARRRMAVAAETRGASLQETTEQYRAAAKALEEASVRGGGPRVHRILGDVHRRMGNAQLALQQFSLAATQERDPKRRADDIQQAGSIFFVAGQYNESLQQYRSALKLDGENGNLYRLYAETLIELGQIGDALAPLTRALELAGPNVDVYRARGSVYAQLGQYREAMDDYTRSLELDANAANILSRRGWAYILHGNDLALRDFERAVKLNPENADSYNGLGYAQVLAGKVTEAVTNARTAVRLAEPQLASQGSQAWPLLYNAATILAQATSRASEEDAEKYASEATELLRRAVGVAGTNLEPIVRRNIELDSALAPVRNRPGFQKAFPAKKQIERSP